MSRKDMLLSKLNHNSDPEMPQISDVSVTNDHMANVSKNTQTTRNPLATESSDEWLSESYEGQLAVDVYQTEDDIVIQSTIAGVSADDIDISVQHDMVTIKGKRHHGTEVSEDDYFYQECYWGGFSRTIILPVDVITEKVEAGLENGILTVRLPKSASSQSRSIKVKAIETE